LINTIDVEICGQRYAIKGEADDEYVKRLAGYVDEQMRALAAGMKTATTSKLAVLAAINIAHQLFQTERRREEGEADVDRRATTLMASIEEHLQMIAPSK
jgi:cell division protein ZapA